MITAKGGVILRTDCLEKAAMAFRFLSGNDLTDSERMTALSAIRSFDGDVRRKQAERAAAKQAKRERQKQRQQQELDASADLTDELSID